MELVKLSPFDVFVVSSVVGIGSLCFHATLLYEMQVRFCLTAKSSLINVGKSGGDDRDHQPAPHVKTETRISSVFNLGLHPLVFAYF